MGLFGCFWTITKRLQFNLIPISNLMKRIDIEVKDK